MLGGAGVVNAILYLVFHGRHYGFDVVSPIYGLALIGIVYGRYRNWFETIPGEHFT